MTKTTLASFYTSRVFWYGYLALALVYLGGCFLIAQKGASGGMNMGNAIHDYKMVFCLTAWLFPVLGISLSVVCICSGFNQCNDKGYCMWSLLQAFFRRVSMGCSPADRMDFSGDWNEPSLKITMKVFLVVLLFVLIPYLGSRIFELFFYDPSWVSEAGLETFILIDYYRTTNGLMMDAVLKIGGLLWVASYSWYWASFVFNWPFVNGAMEEFVCENDNNLAIRKAGAMFVPASMREEYGDGMTSCEKRYMLGREHSPARSFIKYMAGFVWTIAVCHCLGLSDFFGRNNDHS